MKIQYLQQRHLGKTQERVSRGAFRLGKREFCSVRQTDNQADWYTWDWSPILKPHLPFGLLSTPLPHPLIPSSLPAILLTSSPHYSEARLWTVFANTHTHTTPHRAPEDYISDPKCSPKSIPVLTKSGERGDWWDRLDTTMQREKWDWGSRYSPTPPPLPRWWHHRGQRPLSCDCD